MPILTVDNHIHDRMLHKPAKPVKNFQSSEVIILVQEMRRIASSPGAVGVAAPQLGVPLQIFALHTKKELPVLFFYNPKIIAMSEETYSTEEGCLSVPGKTCKLQRHSEVTLVWQDDLGKKFDPKGRKYQFNFSGFEAQAVQHEMNHLQATLVTDIAEEIYDNNQFQKAFDEAQKETEKEEEKLVNEE